MIIILCISILFISHLYICEIIKRKEIEKEELELEKKYADTLSKNMELTSMINEIKEEFNKEKDMAEEIKSLHKKTRTLKHDMKNNIMIITAYLNDREYDKASSYLSNILDDLNKIYTYIETGNSLLNYVINTKLQYAKNNNIDIKAEIENLSFDQIGSVDFSALLNNLLDNAIEGSIISSNKQIIINILRKRGYDTILIKNRIDQSVLDDNPNLESTKENKEEHGYGLMHVKALVEKYNGMIDIYEEDNFFCVYVVYPY